MFHVPLYLILRGTIHIMSHVRYNVTNHLSHSTKRCAVSVSHRFMITACFTNCYCCNDVYDVLVVAYSFHD